MAHTSDPSILETDDSEYEPSLGDIVRPYLKKKKMGDGQEENKEQVEYEDERRKEERR